MGVLVVGLVLFLGAHVFVTMRAPRAAVIARIGEWPYKGLMALVSLVGPHPDRLRLRGIPGERLDRRLVSAAMDLLRHPDPDVAGEHLRRRRLYPRQYLASRSSTPCWSGVKTWAVAHLISNGDLGSIVLFGSFLAWAVYDRITLKRRTDPGAPPIPVGGHRNDMIALVVGTILYLALGLVFHPLVVGVPVFGRPAH